MTNEQIVRDALAHIDVTASYFVERHGMRRNSAASILRKLHKAGEVSRERAVTHKKGQPAWVYSLVRK